MKKLESAIMFESLDKVKLLIENEKIDMKEYHKYVLENDRETILQTAIFYGDVDKLNYLLDMGADIEATSITINPLCSAIVLKDKSDDYKGYQMLETLFKRGANPNASDKKYPDLVYFLAVVHDAEDYISLKTLKLFLKYGYDVNLTDGHGDTLLHILVGDQYEEDNKHLYNLVKMIIDKGANIYIKNKKGEIPRDIYLKLDSFDKSIYNLLIGK